MVQEWESVTWDEVREEQKIKFEPYFLYGENFFLQFDKVIRSFYTFSRSLSRLPHSDSVPSH